jgi:hypothetical protein
MSVCDALPEGHAQANAKVKELFGELFEEVR